jgi:hypothetical protein
VGKLIRLRRGHRTSFAPETTSSKRNKRNRTGTKMQQKSTRPTNILPLITVWLQGRVLPGVMSLTQ